MTVLIECTTCSDIGAAPCDLDRYPRGICPHAPPNWEMKYGPPDVPCSPISVLVRSKPHAHPCHRCGAEGSLLHDALRRAMGALDEAARCLEAIGKADRDVPRFDPPAQQIAEWLTRAHGSAARAVMETKT